MRIFIIARDIQRHDAVGNFCRQIHELLTAHEFEAHLVAENCHPDDRSFVAPLTDVISQIAQDDIVILHFSIGDPTLATIAALETPKILYFHNITPEHFFHGVDEPAAALARLGLEQRPLARFFDVMMANSAVAARVLHDGLAPADQQSVSESSIIVCPPFIGIRRWDRIDRRDEVSFADERTILSVGRLAPHKGIPELIDGFEMLAMRDPSVKLLFIGSSATAYYASTIVDRVNALAPPIASRVRLLHGITDGELKAIYEKVGVCTSMSLHEGFGIPLVDALIFDTPLVIRAEAAMMETAGDAAIVVSHTEPGAIADALIAALDDGATRQRLARARQQRLTILGKLADGELILEAVNTVRRSHRARVV